jgi:methylenetetrahydrofolate dehydrogenase (NADP+)/methenyltetrahydrofolate cyclohydrolase
MTARILDGKALAAQLKMELAERIRSFQLRTSVQPHLAAVLVGDDPASAVYVRNKERDCEKVGIASTVIKEPGSMTQSQLLDLVDSLNKNPAVHGILVQLPLPAQIAEQAVLDRLTPLKDVDAFHAENVGLIVQGRPRYLPCTPAGVQTLLAREEIKTAGKHVVVIGRSNIVGRPLSVLLSATDSRFGKDYANATVTLCHSRTQNVAELTQQADILVAAVGKAGFVTADMVREGTVVIDVGTNRSEAGKLVGDVDFAAVAAKASAITPVPGGIGPLTIALLLENTFRAAELATA